MPKQPRQFAPQPEVPTFLDGENPWQQLQPGAEEEATAESLEAAAQNRIEVAALMARAFNNPDAREAFEFIVAQAKAGHPTFVPGWTVDQLAPMMMRRDAIVDMVEWIGHQIEISLNANV